MFDTGELLRLRTGYLCDAMNLNDDEQYLSFETSKRLPSRIIDAHAHCALPENIRNIDNRAYSHPMSTIPCLTINESEKLNCLFYPNITVDTLRFGMVYRGVNYKAMNDYLLRESPKNDRVALFGVQDDLGYTIGELETGRYVGLKMYCLYARPTATKILEVFPKEILSVVEKLGIPIILHLPRIILESIDEIIELKQLFPELKATVCHLGSSEIFDHGLRFCFERLLHETDFMLDTAYNHCSESIDLAFDVLGSMRIMYGSDVPINLLRTVPYIHPEKGKRVVTDKLYHWSDKSEYEAYRYLANGAPHAHWQCIKNLLDIIESKFPLDVDYVKQAVFYDNAKKFYKF